MADVVKQDEPGKKRHVEYQKMVTYLIATPVWALNALNKANRPRPNWTIERVLRVRIMKRNSRIAAL